MSRIRTLLGLVAVLSLITAGCRNRECKSNRAQADSCSGYSCPK